MLHKFVDSPTWFSSQTLSIGMGPRFPFALHWDVFRCHQSVRQTWSGILRPTPKPNSRHKGVVFAGKGQSGQFTG